MSFIYLNPLRTAPVSASPFELAPFAEPRALEYCAALSQKLLQDPEARRYPDLIALGFWLRPAQINNMLAPYQKEIIRPVGHVFHAAPGNVDSLFVYSGILSLLCGNKNTIRLSSQAGGSALLFCQYVQELAPEFPEVNARFQLVQSAHNSKNLAELVAQVDARVLWGSERGIQALRALPMPAHAREQTFANKLSFAVIDSEQLQNASEDEKQQLAENFARDNLTFAQQACSSAKLIFWLADKNGEVSAAVKNEFWHILDVYLSSEAGQQKYALTPSEQYQALNNAQLLAAQGQVQNIQAKAHFVRARTTLECLNTGTSCLSQTQASLIEAHLGHGFFIEAELANLEALQPILTASHQTLTYWGVDKKDIQAWLGQCLTGIDRAVPIGEALSFTPVWDGVNLMRFFSRQLA